MLLSYAIVDFYLFHDGASDMQIWALLTVCQCRVSDTQVTFRACGPLVKIINISNIFNNVNHQIHNIHNFLVNVYDIYNFYFYVAMWDLLSPISRLLILRQTSWLMLTKKKIDAWVRLTQILLNDLNDYYLGKYGLYVTICSKPKD